MKNAIYFLALFACITLSCKQVEFNVADETTTNPGYFDYSGSDDQFTGGVKMIPITTPKGTFNVWTKRVG